MQGNNERARACLAGKSHARKKICTVLEKVTFRTAKGRNAPFFLAQEGKNSKKSPEKRAHLEKATLHHCDRGTPSCQRRGGRSKSTDPHRQTAHLDYSTEKSPFSVSCVTVSRTVSPCIVTETRNRLQSQGESEGKIMQRGTSTELTLEKIKAFEKDHLEIGRREEYYDPERLAVIKQTFNRIYSNCLQDGLPESFGLISALQAMIDAGYRAGKRAERARRKTQAA